MLDLPDAVEAEAIGQLDLVERVLQQSVLAVVRPRARQLVLVKQTEAHAGHGTVRQWGS